MKPVPLLFSKRVKCGGGCRPPSWVGLFFLFVLPLFLGAPATRAQEKNPFAGDPKEAKLGEFQFRANCAFCHGLGAKGGGRGPDLTRQQKKHGNADSDLYQTINDGVPGTAMPPNGATQQGVGMTPEEIWQVITYIRSVEVKNAAAPTGNPIHGEELFYGSAACSTCHMIAGKGGRLGPDLTTAGTARSVDYLKESVRAPSRRLAQGISEAMKEFSQEYETVSVVAADGTAFQGVVLNEDSFTVQMMDTREQIHSFAKLQLKSFEKTRVSLMPAYDAKTLSEKDLDDLLAYLLKVSTDQGGAQ
jgi:cytochrome c oxidase cbb3-type subunit 3